MSLLSLRTARLRAMPWQQLSEAELADLFAPDVVQWLPGGFQGLAGDAPRRAFLAALSNEADVAALQDSTGQGIGLVILSAPQQEAGLHGGALRSLGYLFAEAAWGQGLATELLGGLQDSLRGSGVTLSGGVMAQNTASARVLEKAGFAAAPAQGETVYRWHAGR